MGAPPSYFYHLMSIKIQYEILPMKTIPDYGVILRDVPSTDIHHIEGYWFRLYNDYLFTRKAITRMKKWKEKGVIMAP